MIKRQLKIIIILLLFILLLAFVVLLLQNQKKITNIPDYTFENEMRKRYNIEILDDDIIIPSNSYKFFTEVTTDASSKEIYENLNCFFKITVNKYIIEVNSDSNIQAFFNKNKSQIYKETGITNNKDFSNLVTELLNISNGQKIVLQELKFSENFIQEDDFTYAEIKAIYENNIILNIGLKVFNISNDDGVFIEYNILEN